MKEFDEYLNGLVLGGKSDATIRVYTKDVRKLISFFNISAISDLDILTVTDYQNFYTSQKLGDVSLNGLIRSLSAFFTWLKDGEYITDNAFFHVRFGKSRFIKTKKVKKIILTDEEIASMIKSADNVQDKFMVALMATTGLRRDEVGKIKLTDIGDCKIIINGKGGKQRTTYMDATVCAMLNIYLAQRDSDSPYLFYGTRGDTSKNGQLSGVSVNNRIHACVKRANIDPEKASHISAHRIRGGAISNIIRDFGIHAAMKFAGHASIATTSIYDETSDEITRNVILARAGKLQGLLEEGE